MGASPPLPGRRLHRAEPFLELLKEALAGRPAVFMQARFVTTDAAPAQLKLEGIREAWVDGDPLPVASEPGRKLQLKPGIHVLTVRLSATDLPTRLKATCPEARFVPEPD